MKALVKINSFSLVHDIHTGILLARRIIIMLHLCVFKNTKLYIVMIVHVYTCIHVHFLVIALTELVSYTVYIWLCACLCVQWRVRHSVKRRSYSWCSAVNMREPPTTSMLETVIAKEMPMVNQFVYRLHSELSLLDYDESVSFLLLFCFYACQSNYWFLLMSYRVWLRVDNGVKECVHSYVCGHNLLAAYIVLCAYLHCIHLCVGRWVCVCVCDCMRVCVCDCMRVCVWERERWHWYCAVYIHVTWSWLCIHIIMYWVLYLGFMIQVVR